MTPEQQSDLLFHIYGAIKELTSICETLTDQQDGRLKWIRVHLDYIEKAADALAED